MNADNRQDNVNKVKAYFDWDAVINPGNLERFTLHIKYLNIEYVVNNLEKYRLDPSDLANYFIGALVKTIETIVDYNEDGGEWEDQELCFVLDDIYTYICSLIEADITKHKADIIEVLSDNSDRYLLYDCTASDLINYLS